MALTKIADSQATRDAIAELASVAGVVPLDDAFSIANVTDTTKTLGFSLAGETTGKKVTIAAANTADATYTLPAATDTLVGRTSTDTLTNKTLTDQIDSGCKVSTAQFDAVTGTTGVTLTNIAGMSVTVTAAGKYIFQAHVTGTSTANSGVKFAIGGTATATSISYTGKNYNGTTINAISSTTTKGNAVGAATAVFTNADIYGAIVVNAGGTLTVQAAQNAAHADTTSVYVNGSFRVTRVA